LCLFWICEKWYNHVLVAWKSMFGYEKFVFKCFCLIEWKSWCCWRMFVNLCFISLLCQSVCLCSGILLMLLWLMWVIMWKWIFGKVGRNYDFGCVIGVMKWWKCYYKCFDHVKCFVMILVCWDWVKWSKSDYLVKNIFLVDFHLLSISQNRATILTQILDVLVQQKSGHNFRISGHRFVSLTWKKQLFPPFFRS